MKSPVVHVIRVSPFQSCTTYTCVRPGLSETRAGALYVMVLSKLDLPTFDRPGNAQA